MLSLLYFSLHVEFIYWDNYKICAKEMKLEGWQVNKKVTDIQEREELG
jgi:hypothetical protein